MGDEIVASQWAFKVSEVEKEFGEMCRGLEYIHDVVGCHVVNLKRIRRNRLRLCLESEEGRERQTSIVFRLELSW
jgi:hypothetical protein